MRGQHVRLLVEKLLGMPFPQFVEPRRAAGMSWASIAHDLMVLINGDEPVDSPRYIRINELTVNRWYSESTSEDP